MRSPARFAVAVALSAIACGPPITESSCNQSNAGLRVCIDTQGPNSGDPNEMRSCMSQGGTWSPALCEHAAAVGGCRRVVGTQTTTIWYYPPADAPTVQRLCATGGLTYVPQ